MHSFSSFFYGKYIEKVYFWNQSPKRPFDCEHFLGVIFHLYVYQII